MIAFATILGQLLLGWLIADLLGGIAHWLEDRVLRVSMPLIGPLIVAPNRRHHRDPMAFLDGGFLSRNRATFILAGAASLLWLLLLGPSLVWAAASLGGALSSIAHQLAHRPGASRAVRVAQQIGLLQSPAQHAQHHRPPSDRRYCVLTDWLNPVLDELGAWGRLERALRIPLDPEIL